MVFQISTATHTNNLLKKVPTSSVVDGPPMFIKTIAVGPFELVASCVTGATTVAIERSGLLRHCDCGSHGVVVEAGANFATVARKVCFASCVICLRRAIVNESCPCLLTFHDFREKYEGWNEDSYRNPCIRGQNNTVSIHDGMCRSALLLWAWKCITNHVIRRQTTCVEPRLPECIT